MHRLYPPRQCSRRFALNLDVLDWAVRDVLSSPLWRLALPRREYPLGKHDERKRDHRHFVHIDAVVLLV